MLNDITNQKIKDINNRFDQLEKKMDINVFALKQINATFKQIKCSYDGTQAEQFLEKGVKTFAGNPLKLIKDKQYR
jgi:hypothetical protein